MHVPRELAQPILEESATALKALLASVAESASENVRRRISIWSAERSLKRVTERLADARMVKTLWSFDQRVDLFSFYYPQRASVSQRRLVVKRLSDLKSESQSAVRIVIGGRVGLGKTILARYLTVVELMGGNKIPIFTELRRLAEGKSLLSHVKASLLLMNIHIDSDVLRHFLKQGRIALFLDGFDEVAPEQRRRLMMQIESLATKYPGVDILITSRPETEIFTLYGFNRADLKHLKEDDIRPLVFRLMDDECEATRLADEVLKTRTNILPLLKTPLMVTLLVISFRTASEVPAVISDFYSRLFISLLNRHDKSKPGGFNRPRKGSLSDTKMQELFNSFSLVTLQENRTEMRFARAVEACKRAARVCGVDPNAVEDFLDDVIGITYLVLREGDIIRFSHKSIQEFHAAAYIADASDSDARQFYQRVRTSDNLVRFAQVLEFLEELDARRYHTNLTLPDYISFLGELRSTAKGEIQGDAVRVMRVQLLNRLNVVVKESGDVEVSLPTMPFVSAQWVLRALRKRPELKELAVLVRSGSYTGFEALRELGHVAGAVDRRRQAAEVAVLAALDEILSELENTARRLERMLKLQAEAATRLLDI